MFVLVNFTIVNVVKNTTQMKTALRTLFPLLLAMFIVKLSLEWNITNCEEIFYTMNDYIMTVCVEMNKIMVSV